MSSEIRRKKDTKKDKFLILILFFNLSAKTVGHFFWRISEYKIFLSLDINHIIKFLYLILTETMLPNKLIINSVLKLKI